MIRVFVTILTLFTSGILGCQEIYEALLRSKAMIDNGMADKAVSLLTGQILKSRDGRLFIMRADAFTVSGNYSAAMNDYQEANKLIPSSGEYGLSRIYAMNHDVKTSLNHLERNLLSPFKKSEKEIFLDNVFSTVENTPEWRLFWKTERYGYEEEKVHEIEYLVSRGNWEEAAQILNDLSNRNPLDDKTIYAKALVDFGMQNYSGSVSALNSVLLKDKSNGQYLLLLAAAQEASGNAAGATETYTRLIELEHIDAELYLKRAGCYRKTQEYSKASGDLEKYLSLYPESKDAVRLSGRIESERGDNLKAIEYFSRNLKLHPGDPECYIDRANSYFISRTWDYAIKDYSMALDMKPDDPEVWLSKGIALLGAGRTEDACHDFRKALDLGNKKATPYISRHCIK